VCITNTEAVKIVSLLLKVFQCVYTYNLLCYTLVTMVIMVSNDY